MITAPQLFTSARSDWETPGSTDRPGTFFYNLHQEFEFDLDAAASELNAKLPVCLTEDDDALTCAWPGRRAFFNNPYGKGNVTGRWLGKASQEFARRGKEAIVGLVAARTDTAWFHDIVMPLADEVRFVRGRLPFELGGKPIMRPDKKGVMRMQLATFPSALIVFRRKPIMRVDESPLFRSVDQAGLLIDEAPL